MNRKIPAQRAVWIIGIVLVFAIAVAVPLLRMWNAGHYPQADARVFQVQSPVSIHSGEISPSTHSQFDVMASAGQYLLISAGDVKFASEAEDPIVVQSLEANSLPLKPLRKGGSCSGTWLYKLSMAGTYRVTFDYKGSSHGLNTTVLDGRNAILEPGITAEQIAIDFRGFAEKSQMHLEPYESGDGCGVDDLGAPAHWMVENSGFELYIIPLEGLKLLSPHDDAIHNLEDALRQKQIVADAQKLPYPAWDDSASVMAVRQELFTGKGWRGLRWISGYAQDGDYPGSLGYTFEGISDDGRLFIMVQASLAHEQQKRDLVELEQSGNNPETETKLRLLLEKTLTAASTDAFRPNLAELDAVVQSLEFLQ
jgi:hypothetical protein